MKPKSTFKTASRRAISKLVLHLDVVCYKEGNLFIAHCLQLDLVTAAKTTEQAFYDMENIIKTHIAYAIENDNLENLFKPAPLEIWRLFPKATVLDDESPRRLKFPKMPPNRIVEIQRLCA
ncbi:MAG: hypothetical protein ACREOW_05785 [Thermodesulfobacteriota bacterium]